MAENSKPALIDGTSVVITVDSSEIKASNKTAPEDWLNSTVKLDSSDGPRYLGTLELFHQLHCLVRSVLALAMEPPLPRKSND